ncbi:Dephospho-CoA kinase [Crinalium epipsammum PCC 9333]|uniref:Dephospho-CoA kinase n=1 Tax=Crinalium epipsammum PCC 9333 TaxID=1173022 RepID=K9VY92_9CYAN|nr:dephospho-CoA kinase [Crinalium epipsammum]AFZ12514.1 Dephospho-CoA kinase [Crinalium epipsammum PCC 9333]
MKRIIGLTGGIGTGKSTVSNYLAERHFPVFDADIYARVAVEPGSAILGRIAARYGASILLTDGSLNRQSLGEIVFNNPDERSWLEQQIHPYVRQHLENDLNSISQSDATVVMVIPLLFEAGMTDLVNEIWVVYCSPTQQLERLIGRDRLKLAQAQARINSQMPLQEKCDRADVILDNTSTLPSLLKQIDLALG